MSSDLFIPSLCVGLLMSFLFYIFSDDDTSYVEHIAATEFCSKNDGYRQINRNMDRYLFVCNDGAEFKVESIKVYENEQN